jgi:cytochrome P450
LSTWTIDPLIDEGVVDAPHDAFAYLREHEPVHRVEGTDLFAVARLDLIHEVVADPATFSSRTDEFLHVLPGPAGELRSASDMMEGDSMPIGVLAIADPPDHSRQRKIVSRVLSTTALGHREGEFRDIADAALAPHVLAGRVDWMQAIAEPLPMLMLCRVLGVPDDAAAFLKDFGYAAVELTNGFATDERMAEIRSALFDLGPIGEIYTSARAGTGPGPDTLIGACAQAVGQSDLDDIEALAIIMMMAAAGGESTASLLGSGARLLAQNLQLQQRLREDPALIPAFVEEACRLESPFRGHYRLVRKDAVLGGVRIPAGSRLVLLWPAANRDPSLVASAPDHVDIDRAAPRQHVGFGWGIHLCVGAPLARLEAKVVFAGLLASTERFVIGGSEPLRHHRSLMIRRLLTLPLTLASAG